MSKMRDLKLEMIKFDEGEPELIQHFIKVHDFAKIIGEIEGISTEDMEVLEAAFLVNFYENNNDKETIEKTYNKIFKTNTGKDICRKMFGI